MELRSQLSQNDVNLQSLEAKIDVSQVQKWLEDCNGEGGHRNCNKRKSDKDDLPRRLIDVGEPKKWPCVPKLLDTTNMQGRDPEATRYIALSHSWGTLSEAEQASLSTTIETLDERRAGIDTLSLPTQYQAVIVLCRCLGIRYLWIDSLCIIQGPQGDWSTESVRMAQIYGWAFLTVSTNTAGNLLESLTDPFGPTSRQLARDILSSVYQEACKMETQLYHTVFWKRVLEGGPIGNRAWCLQERHLSPRVLHLIDGGIMLYECTGTIYSTASKDVFSFAKEPEHARRLSREMSRDLMPRVIDLKLRDANARDFLRFWYSVFTDYQKRQLTFRADNLTALQGIAELMSQSGTYTYLSGIWLEDLARGLLWARDNRGKWKDDADDETRRRAWTRFPHYQGPTWSWCAVNGSTRMHDIDRSLAHVHEVENSQKEKGPQRLKNRFALFTLVNVKVLRSGGGVSPLQEGSYIEMDALICPFRYVCGWHDNTGHLESSPGCPRPYVECGSVVFDIPADWRARDIWCLAIASPPGVSMNPGRQEYLGLALVPLDAGSQQDSSGAVPQGDANHPFEFRRLGLAIMRILRDFGCKIDDEELRSLNELQQVGFKGPTRVRLF